MVLICHGTDWWLSSDLSNKNHADKTVQNHIKGGGPCMCLCLKMVVYPKIVWFFPRTWWSSDQVFITPTHVFALASMRYTVRSCSLYSKGPWAGKGCLAGGGIHNSNARRSCASAIDSWVVAAFNPRCCVPLYRLATGWLRTDFL